MGLFRNSRELQFTDSKPWQKPQANPRNKGEEHYFIEKKEDIRRGGLKRKSIGEKSEFRVVQGGFSLAELLGESISYRKYNHHLFL